MEIYSFIQQLINKENLSRKESRKIMTGVMSGKVSHIQLCAFLTALRSKGETADEITGCAEAMREKSSRIAPKAKDLVDTCGTGGDMTGTFNISTTSAFVVAGCGIPVAKHGNKSNSSKCGSAELLEALGININLPPPQAKKSIEQAGIGFMFAPLFHSAMKYAIPVRKEIKIRTVFNLLGPLTNPAGALRQVIGVFDHKLTDIIAKVMKNLGAEHVLVVHGQGLDEFALGRSKVSELKGGKIRSYMFDAKKIGLQYAKTSFLKGGTPEKNAKITLSILQGQKGHKRDIVVLNSAAAIYVSGKSNSIKEGIILAERSIDSGAAYRKLEELQRFK